jgi:hypothetical protein
MEMKQHQYQRNPEIGTAWHGKHIIMINCNPFTSQVISINKSLHAPFEPVHPNCAETLSRLFSIGYQLVTTVPISKYEIQYILMME